MDKSYHDALTVALANAGGADSSLLASWAEALRAADDALDGAIAAAVRSGEAEKAQDLADRGSDLQACADFLDKLFAELEQP